MLSLMVVPLASSLDTIEHGTGLASAFKFKDNMTISLRKKHGSTSRENMCHYGYASNA
jgi:hypothetical protein